MTEKIAALVPMRHNSQRVSGKNYRDFAGRPLYHWVIRSLLSCNDITEVVIDTDSDTIMQDAKLNFPEVTLLKRPSHLTAGEIPMNDVLMNSLNQINADFYLQTHSTNPLLSSDTVQMAVNTFKKNHPVYDSLFSVTRRQTRYWDSLARAINHNPNILLRTQDLPPTFEENSCIYIFSKEILATKHNRIGNRPYLFEMEEEEAQDIDVELDFKVAEFLFRQKYSESIES